MLLWEYLSTCPCGVIEHPLDIYPKVVLLGLAEGCFLIFWEITIVISKEAVPVCTPTSNAEVFPLPHILSSISCHQCLTILTGVRWNLRSVLVCTSLTVKDVRYFLKCLSAVLDSSVESSLFMSSIHFLNLIICSLNEQFLYLCIFWRSCLYLIWCWWRSFPSSRGPDLAFNSLIILLCWELTLLKASDSIFIHLASEFGIIVFTAEVNLCKKSTKVSFGTCITLGNDSISFPHFSNYVPSIQSCCMT